MSDADPQRLALKFPQVFPVSAIRRNEATAFHNLALLWCKLECLSGTNKNKKCQIIGK
ncbi:hypothetical protein MM424_004966 [Salmonella enterica]|nr:hypothetical protein [Salmonella enterica]